VLPSFKYIQSKIGFSDIIEEDECYQSLEDQFSMSIQTPKEQIRDMILKIKDILETADYQGDNLTELKKISSALRHNQDDAEICRQSIRSLATIIDRDGITYYEITQSELGKYNLK
jgi:formate-dependent nitrite reductase cytochrome c552 subunit